jgi:phospholipid/cholesterol/gamma-HCH transport system substrate-binding protein
MQTKTQNNIKLGVLVSAGVLLLIVSLYIIGRNQQLFGSSFELKTRFRNVNGLMTGNNIRFNGIQAGTVKKISMLNDTTVEVTMLISEEMKPFIGKKSLVSIGNEGLMGNKVVNIIPWGKADVEVEEGDLLQAVKTGDTDDLMNSLSYTGDNVNEISAQLVQTVKRINNSKVLWRLLDDTTLPENVHQTMANLKIASERIATVSDDLENILKGVKQGEGVAGTIFADDTAGRQLKMAISNINKASTELVIVLSRIDSLAMDTRGSINNGRGVVHELLNDTGMVNRVNTSLKNVEKGTSDFSKSMDALKNNFLFKRYFKKQQKKQEKSK